MNEPLPWQEEQWRSVSGRLRTATLPHALLLAGPAGLGKRNFGQRLAQAALCEQRGRQGEPCGRCRACTLYAAHSHPDLRVVAPSEAGKAIVVDQVREAIAFLAHTPQYGGYKVLIIDPADAMNVNAANSLLKTLEEPSGRSLLLLVSARPARLPATILSRCQRITFAAPAAEHARRWLGERGAAGAEADLLLALAEGAPLRAAALREEGMLPMRLEVLRGLEGVRRGDAICVVAEALVKQGLQAALLWMYKVVADVARLHAGAGTAALSNRDFAAELSQLAQAVAPVALLGFLHELHRGLSRAERPLNPQLVMEDLLLSWQDLFAPPS